MPATARTATRSQEIRRHLQLDAAVTLPQAQLGDAEFHLTRSGRRNYVFFYGVSPSNPLAFEAAARVRRSHA